MRTVAGATAAGAIVTPTTTVKKSRRESKRVLQGILASAGFGRLCFTRVLTRRPGVRGGELSGTVVFESQAGLSLGPGGGLGQGRQSGVRVSFRVAEKTAVDRIGQHKS